MSIYVAEDFTLAVTVTAAVVDAIDADSVLTIVVRLNDVSFFSKFTQLLSSSLSILFDEFVQLVFLEIQQIYTYS